MDGLLSALLLILGSLIVLVMALLVVAVFLIFAGPPDLHDFDIDSEQDPKNRKNTNK